MTDNQRILLFLTPIVIVYVLATGIVVRAIINRLAHRTATYNKARRWVHRVVLSVAALGLICMAYGYFVEPYWPSVSRVQIKSHRLAPGSPPIRIAHISDLHCDPKPRLEERLPDIIAAEKPDVIVFTGDSVNSPEGLPVLRACLTRLAAVAPTFAVRGNWDTWYWSSLKLFDGTGVEELNGTAREVKIGGSSIWIAGVAVENEISVDQALAPVPQGALTVFLHHYPEFITEIAPRGVDLFCAGHTHGGQIALPLYGAIVTLSKFGKKYEAGLYRVDQTAMYVNRGIGMEGGAAPRVRFWARPEITIIEITPEN